MSRRIPEAVHDLCLSLPGAEQTLSHGMPTFKVAGKTFAHFVVNHHGDGRVALWLHLPKTSQALYTDLDTGAYFIPPYVGPRGWLGVELNRGLPWAEVVARVREAYEHVAPAELVNKLPAVIDIEPPNVEMTAEEINPLLGKQPREILAQLAELCRRLPETSQGEEYGNPAWKAGKKTFVRVRYNDGRLKMMFWAGLEMQPFFAEDPRFSVPKYYGPSGWIELDVQDGANWEEIASLLETSYRNFALKRMLKALDGG